MFEEEGEAASGQVKLIILAMMETSIDAQSFSKEVGIGSSLHCLLGRGCNR